jgi:glucose/arabinose dehydrogenase
VNQQSGALRVIRNGVLQAAPMLTLSGATTCKTTSTGAAGTVGFVSGGERGFLSAAFHPQFASNGQLFLSFSDINGDTMITRYTMADPSVDALSANDLATCLVILRVDQDAPNHNGGNIVFGPDGYLYIGMGDGGGGAASPNTSGGDDGCNRAQTLDPATLSISNNCASDTNFTGGGGNANSRALLGKMLRINVDATTASGANGLCASAADGSANYAIPPGNPFFDGSTTNGCDEVWAYGLRNPWRWSFDRSNGDLMLADVGQNLWEEVDRIPAGSPFGKDFGWNICEGTHARGSCTLACSDPGSVPPIIEYDHDTCAGVTAPSGCSITGGFRYRGPDPVLQAVYFYGDNCRSELRYSVDTGSNTWVQPSAAVIKTGLAGGVFAFGEDQDGALYMIGGGTLYRIGATGPPNDIFEDGFEDP